MFKNSKKQGDAALGQAIAYFTSKGYDVALPLTDSADWDLIVEIDNILKRVQVKSSSQLNKTNGTMRFNAKVTGGNMSLNKPSKFIQEQNWDLIFLYHFITDKQLLIPKEALTTTKDAIVIGRKYTEFLLN